MPLPADYPEGVYAGVLGKLIGVYLGHPFEQWSHERIQAELGEITYYVHEKRGMPLIVTDDISGTFTFLRALPDYGSSLDLTPAQIGRPGSTTSSKTEPSCGGGVALICTEGRMATDAVTISPIQK